MAAQRPPNILLMMDDQHRWDYLGCYGAQFVDTPHIDRLAANGIRFANAFTNAPVCAPARIGLATGMHPARIGTLENDTYLPPQLPTYYQRLRDSGYRVGVIGKLDLAKPDKYNGRYGDRPRSFSWGFTHPEECEGKVHAALGYPDAPLRGPYTHYLNDKGQLEAFCQDYHKRIEIGSYVRASHDSVLSAEDHEDGYIGRRAAQWIENIPDDFPWHLFVSFVGPHDPFDPPTEYADQFRNAAMPAAIPDHRDQKPAWVRARPRWVSDGASDVDSDELANVRRQYCALIKLIDDQIGMILDALKKRTMLDNTYIIFVSDHGEMLGDHTLFTKSVPYEPAIHIPLICAGPGIEQGRVSDTFIELIDLNPTICRLAGIEPAPGMDACSFVPVLFGDETEHRQEIVTAMWNWRCIRTAQYKLVDNTNDITELYDLAADPRETKNIADPQGEIVAQLRKRLKQYFLRGKNIATMLAASQSGMPQYSPYE